MRRSETMPHISISVTFFVICVLIWGLFAVSVAAENEAVMTLVDGTKLNGELIHFYQGVFEIKTRESLLTIPLEKVVTISFAKKKAKAEFATPEKTFDTWIKAIRDGNIDQMIECYGLLYQNVIIRQLQDLNEKERKDAFKEFLDSGVKIVSKEEKDDAVLLNVELQKEGEQEIVPLKLINESGEWKLYP